MRVFIRSESPSTSAPPLEVFLLEERTGVDEWRRFDYAYAIPEGYDNLRIELNVLTPGTVWVDDLRVEPAGGSSPGAETS
ncbi:MAG: hypothetical protein ABFS34_14405 [Gemmatimonadota bacterium]